MSQWASASFELEYGRCWMGKLADTLNGAIMESVRWNWLLESRPGMHYLLFLTGDLNRQWWKAVFIPI